MSGTKPTSIVVRTFRGQHLYLVKRDRRMASWAWSNDRAKALRMTVEAALDATVRAQREWSADCAVQDATGTMARRGFMANRCDANVHVIPHTSNCPSFFNVKRGRTS